MEITVKKCFTDSGKKGQLVATQNIDLKEAFIELLKSKNEYNQESISWKDTHSVEVNDISSMTLHSFLLKAEELGKRVLLEKKMVIKILD